MDLTSYILGKKSGGGSTPTGTINITENGIVDVSSYANADVNVNPIDPRLIEMGFTNSIGISDRGYNFANTIIQNWDSSVTNCSLKYRNNGNITYFPLVDTSNVENMSQMFYGCSSMIAIAKINTSKVTDMGGMFKNVYPLTSVPIFDTSSVTNMTQMFTNCNNLSNESLDNILQICINASSYEGTKTLGQLGFSASKYPVSMFTSLPHYQAFLDAGWEIGY